MTDWENRTHDEFENKIKLCGTMESTPLKKLDALRFALVLEVVSREVSSTTGSFVLWDFVPNETDAHGGLLPR